MVALETQMCNWFLSIFSSLWALANEATRGNTKQTEPISFLVLQRTENRESRWTKIVVVGLCVMSVLVLHGRWLYKGEL